jgi:ParB family chromosome partitioning protein
MKIDNAKIRTISTELQKPIDYSKRTSSFTSNYRSEITYLSVDQLIPYRHQARLIFEQEEIDMLAQTIEEHGIRQPLTVLRVDLTDKVFFEVVSGERRLRAAKQIGLTTVPCIIIEDENKAEEIALIENVQRKDLHPIELARTLKKLIDKIGYGGQSELRKRLGFSQSQISELLKLMSLPQVVQDEILTLDYRGRDSFRALSKITSEEEQIYFIRKNAQKINEIKEDGVFEKNNLDKAQSLMRLTIKDGQITIQKNKIISLADEQKKQLKMILTDILKEL